MEDPLVGNEFSEESDWLPSSDPPDETENSEAEFLSQV